MIIIVKLIFTLATILFVAGYTQRRRNNDLHRQLMAWGFASTIAIAVVLVVGVNIFDGQYSPAGWLMDLTGSEAGARAVLLAHRGVATLTFLLLLTQVILGLRRHPLHLKLHRLVVPLWAITYGSGLVVFV